MNRRAPIQEMEREAILSGVAPKTLANKLSGTMAQENHPQCLVSRAMAKPPPRPHVARLKSLLQLPPVCLKRAWKPKGREASTRDANLKDSPRRTGRGGQREAVTITKRSRPPCSANSNAQGAHSKTTTNPKRLQACSRSRCAKLKIPDSSKR